MNQWAIFLPSLAIVIEHIKYVGYSSGLRDTFLKQTEMVLSSQTLYPRKVGNNISPRLRYLHFFS